MFVSSIRRAWSQPKRLRRLAPFTLACAAGIARFIVVVDLLQGLLFAILRFDLAYSRNTPDHFATNHLLVGQLIALALLLIAGLACLGAASRAEFRFLREGRHRPTQIGFVVWMVKARTKACAVSGPMSRFSAACLEKMWV